MKTKTHEGPHQYVRSTFKQSGTDIFKCVLGCPHFVYEAQIIGREAKCGRCGSAFIITNKSLRAKKLHCEDCTRLRYNKPKPKAEVIPEELGADVDALLQQSNELLNKGEGI